MQISYGGSLEKNESGKMDVRHPVIRALQERTLSESKPGSRSDSYKIGIAIEGGGMRGVVSAGMLLGLHHLNMLNAFDLIFGTSVGAINGAYFIANQAPDGAEIYYKILNSKKFIDFKRVLSKKTIISSDFLLHHVLEELKVLNFEKILISPIPLKVLVSSMTRFQAVTLEGFKSKNELIEALRASTRILAAAGPPVEINGDRCIDGGVFEPIPFRKAVADGCTHILTLLTRPANTLRCKLSLFDRFVGKKLMERYDKRLGEVFTKRPQKYCDDIHFLMQQTKNPTSFPYHFAVQLPDDTKPIKKVERSEKKLKTGLQKAMKTIMCQITGSESPNIFVPCHETEMKTYEAT